MDRVQSGDSPGKANLEMGISAKKIVGWVNAQLSRLGKLKYALIAVLIGILFLLPTKKEKTTISVMAPSETEIASHELDIEAKMSEILSAVQGAGAVRVMLTLKNNGETEFQTDVENYSNGEQTEIRSETVFGNSSSGGAALVRRQSTPEYLGALVISQGADSPEVCLKLTKAVCSLTGLGSDKVTVLKMEN